MEGVAARDGALWYEPEAGAIAGYRGRASGGIEAPLCPGLEVGAAGAAEDAVAALGRLGCSNPCPLNWRPFMKL